MGVFLRWGIFGILSVAALVYAYNASKRMSENHQARKAEVVSQQEAEEAEPADDSESEPETEPEEEPEPLAPLPAQCEEERQVAERALKMRRDGEPLDVLLRIDLIAFQSDGARRERLEAVAKRWFERAGADPNGAALREQVARDCRPQNEAVTPAP